MTEKNNSNLFHQYMKTLQPEAVILANGLFPTHPIPLTVLQRAKYLCCCDGAAANLQRKPDAIVGDGDSLSPSLKEYYKDIIHTESEQEYNDLTKATRFCLEQGFRHIAYVGATGKREDHTLGNISLMAYYKKLGVEPVFLTDYGCLTVHKGYHELLTFKGQQVSIFNISCSELSGEGLKWNLSPYHSFWQGTLNEATGEKIMLHGDGIFMVFRNYDAE